MHSSTSMPDRNATSQSTSVTYSTVSQAALSNWDAIMRASAHRHATVSSDRRAMTSSYRHTTAMMSSNWCPAMTTSNRCSTVASSDRSSA